MSGYPKSKVLTFHDPIYETSYEVLFTEDTDEATNFLDVLICSEGAFTYAQEMDIKLWFGRWDIRALAHEAIHCVDHVFDCINGENSEKQSEPRAYYMGWLMQELTQALEKACQPTRNRKTTAKTKSK